LGKYGKRPGIAGAGRCLQGAEGMTATVTVNDAEFLALLETMKSRVTNLRPAMVDIGANLVSLIHDKLGIGMTPWGEAMKPLRYKRKHATKFGEGIPLNDTRMHIYQRITYRADTTSLSVGMLDSATAKIGQVHQFGAQAHNQFQGQCKDRKIQVFKIEKGKLPAGRDHSGALGNHSRKAIHAHPQRSCRPSNRLDGPGFGNHAQTSNRQMR
jgi:hypothetical protein